MGERMVEDRVRRIDRTRRRASVLLLDDRSVVPSGCRALLEHDPTVLIAAETAHFTEVPGLVAREPPRIVVTAAAGGALGAVGLVCAIREVAPTAQVIVVSPRLEQGHVRATLHAGARAYVMPDDPHLARAVRAVAEGGAYFSPEVANLLREGYLEGIAQPSDTLLGRLNETERAVLRCLIDGLTTAQTASRLQTSSAAIDAHRRHIVEVLAPSRADGAAQKQRAH
jgi:DNA-binding NarL/FixJ family response regulator